MTQKNETKRLLLCIAELLLIMSCFLPGCHGSLFTIHNHNYYAATSFLLLTVATGIHLGLNYMRYEESLTHQLSHSQLKFWMNFGCFMILVSLAYSIYLLDMGVKYETELAFDYTNYYFLLVPCLLSSLWYAGLVYKIRSCW